MSPTVSILMPVFNAEGTLPAAVDCILAQTVSDWELILVDDGSSDRSGALCDAYAQKDPRIRSLRLERNGGAGAARNRGLQEARGEYLLMLDSDDLFDPDMLERGLEALKDAEAVVWGVTEEVPDKKGGLRRQREILLPAASRLTGEEMHRAFLRLESATLFGYCCNKLFRRDTVERAEIRFPQKPLYEDFLFNAAWAPHVASLAILPTAPVHYIHRGTGLTSRFVKEYFPLSRERVETMWELCRGWGIADGETRQRLGAIYARYIFSALQRNCDPRMGMDRAARRAFLQQIFDSELFRETVPYAAPEGRLSAFLARQLKRRRRGVCLALGRGIYAVHTGLPGLFARAARK